MTSPHSERLEVGVLRALRPTVEREFPLDSLERVADRLVRPQGRVWVRLHVTEAGDFPALQGDLRANPWLVCQRCLEPFEASVDAEVRVALVATDAEAERVPSEFEPVETQNGVVDLFALVEDELLLALPLVPVHESAEECAAAREVVMEPEPAPEPAPAPVHRPFGDLRSLMKR